MGFKYHANKKTYICILFHVLHYFPHFNVFSNLSYTSVTDPVQLNYIL